MTDLFLTPAPIDPRLVRRVSPLGPWPDNGRLSPEERHARKLAKDARYRERNRAKRIAYDRARHARARNERKGA